MLITGIVRCAGAILLLAMVVTHHLPQSEMHTAHVLVLHNVVMNVWTLTL